MFGTSEGFESPLVARGRRPAGGATWYQVLANAPPSAWLHVGGTPKGTGIVTRHAG